MSDERLAQARNEAGQRWPGVAEVPEIDVMRSDMRRGFMRGVEWADVNPKPADGDTSDGYHTFDELYTYRMLYNAHAARGWLAAGIPVVKSWRHSDGELCFGGGWFIVTAELPTGQVSNHYEARHWALFKVPEVERAPEWDGHTPGEAAQRLRDALGDETGDDDE